MNSKILEILGEYKYLSDNDNYSFYRIDNEIKRIKGLPISRYDEERKMAYLEYPDGRREYQENV